jgi:ABC-type thiamin/hydroxymethylpyrimidine transport system permease subunit
MADNRGPDEGQAVVCRQRLTAVLAEVWETAEGGGPDFSSLVADALQGLAAELGGAGLLTRSRPESWEAAAVATLAASLDDDWSVGL